MILYRLMIDCRKLKSFIIGNKSGVFICVFNIEEMTNKKLLIITKLSKSISKYFYT